jgi:hypothetical protein
LSTAEIERKRVCAESLCCSLAALFSALKGLRGKRRKRVERVKSFLLTLFFSFMLLAKKEPPDPLKGEP